MPDINQQYELLQLKNIAAVNKRIRKIYDAGIQEIIVTLSSVKYNGKLFKLSDYPQLRKKVDSVISKMHTDVYAVSLNGIQESWDLANKKNNTILDKRLIGQKISKKVKLILYDPNKAALSSFISRKEKGLNLSDRVWNTLDPFRKELEQSLGLSIAKGESAISTAKQIKQYLNQPDKLFRRVRTEEGKLVLSKEARDYHPGQGVYRSSYKNALRLSRTENNLAYRYSDHERWQNMPFVTGIEVKLSKAHPKYDICDTLVGKYPKDFKFGGWHPQCLCYQVPVLNSDEDFEAMENAVLAGEPVPEAAGQIRDTPKGFKDWLKDNSQRVDGWKNKPYWMKDNEGYVKEAISGKQPADDISDKTIKAISKKDEYKNELEWAKKAIDRWRKDDRPDSWDLSGIETHGLSDNEAKVLYAYTSQAYRPLNQELYGFKKLTAESKHYEKELNKVLDKMPIHTGDVIRKYIPEPGGPKADDLLAVYKKSEVIKFDGFLSTSSDLDFSWGGEINYHIKSKNGRLVNSISAHTHEEEVLFKSKTSFKILKIKGKDVYLEELD